MNMVFIMNLKLVRTNLVSEHSIGFKTLREQKGIDANEIHDVMLFEGSSLTAWGANENTPLTGMKNMKSIEKIQDQIKAFEVEAPLQQKDEASLEQSLLSVLSKF